MNQAIDEEKCSSLSRVHPKTLPLIFVPSRLY